EVAEARPKAALDVARQAHGDHAALARRCHHRAELRRAAPVDDPLAQSTRAPAQPAWIDWHFLLMILASPRAPADALRGARRLVADRRRHLPALGPRRVAAQPLEPRRVLARADAP